MMKIDNKKGLIDMDLIVYMIGSVCDGKYYTYKGDRYTSKEELNRTLKEDGVDPMSIKPQTSPLSWTKSKVILTNYTEEILDPFDDYQGYLSGKGNFRYDVATILPYKGTRTTEKPYHYDAIRQFLVDTYGAKVSVGQEADDEVGLAQRDDTVIVSTDKDLDVVPMSHYNWVTGKYYEMSEVDSNRSYFKQCLTGDGTDNILGLFGVGKKSAMCKQIDKMEDPDEMADLVYTQYAKRFGSYTDQFIKENATLLWIRQERPCPAPWGPQ